MAKNEQSREANQPIWFDGKSINEALFCDDFLGRHKIIYTNGAFFTPDGRVTDELPLRGEIFEELKCCAVSNIPRKISNIVELMKLAALAEDFPPEIRDRACSLAMAAGREIDRCRVAAAMMEALWEMDASLFTGKKDMLRFYRENCVTIGKEISVVGAGEVRHGRALDVDDEGALVVEFPDSHVEAVNAGEVSIRGMYGYI